MPRIGGDYPSIYRGESCPLADRKQVLICFEVGDRVEWITPRRRQQKDRIQTQT